MSEEPNLRLPPGLEPLHGAESAPLEYSYRAPSKLFGLVKGGELSGALADGSAEAQERQRQTVEASGLPLAVCAPKSGIVFRLIPAGTFTMGSPEDEASRGEDETQHQVEISIPFYLGMLPVIQGQWQAVTGAPPSSAAGAPMERVSWDDCQAFLQMLADLEGVPPGTFRLPTESEWEYACRAGTQTTLYNGDLTSQDDRCENLEQIAWYIENSDDAMQPVGEKLANAWGLHDMLGSVWEWCSDWLGLYPEGGVTDPIGAAPGASFRSCVWRS